MSSSMMSSMNLWEVLSHVINLVVAYVLALPIGWNREREERSAGIRTFNGRLRLRAGRDRRPGRSFARPGTGLITGVGFIGGGAILKHGTQALGTATAASLWATGALGAAVGYGLYDIAVILSAVTFVTLYLAPLKEAAREADSKEEPRDGS